MKLLPAFVLCLASLLPADDAKDLKAKDPLVRLAAVERIVESKGEKAEKLLLSALRDDDWEVVLHAARGLGEVGGDKSVAPLATLAWDGPVRVVRLAAAESLGKIDPGKGMDKIAKKLTGKESIPAAEAYAVVARYAEGGKPSRALDKVLKGKDSLARAAAARALVIAAREERAATLTRLLDHEHAGVVAGALDAAAVDPHAERIPPLVAFLQYGRLADVHERRALRALARSIGAAADPAAAFATRTGQLAGDSSPEPAARGARLTLHCAAEDWFPAARLHELLVQARTHGDVAPRAAAAHALRHGAAAACLPLLREMVETDKYPRVRRAALAASLVHASLDDDTQRAWIIERLGADPDEAVRTDLVVALAVRDHPDAATALVGALKDGDAGVAVCAAVSLGRTRDAGAVQHLAPLLAHGDWRMRGAAVVGLSHCFDVGAIPHVIQALADEEPAVVAAAHSWLSTVNRGQPIPPDPERWLAWWKQNEKRIHLRDPDEDDARRERFGASSTLKDVYAGLDVLVVESRGDHIQNLLEYLGIDFRLTRSGRLPEDGCDPTGVCIVNCTGEVERDDVDRMRWFVQVGGYLFGSCWALHETIERIDRRSPVRRLDTMSEVMDRVTAVSCAEDSRYLEGVFENEVVPIYELEGAHLIEVLEHERVEVLVDSPECAERWGEGNLACWYRFGHGKILDSVNHFDLQGFERAVGLKKPEERMAYAIDHMGASFATLRETKGEKFWSSNPRAGQVVRDLSVLKLITNFVRLRRLEGS